MGEVWRARHLALESYVAIKFLHAAPAQQESARKRFVTEAQLTAQIKTRHAVQVFDFGVTEAGRPFIVMELLDGETVGHRLERTGRLPRAATVRFLQQAARALDRAHALGIVHRDFKPDNLVIVKEEDGREFIKVLDFGIAKLLGDFEANSSQPPSSQGEDTLVDGDVPASMTSTNAILGTPHYMAPEQVRRDEPGPAIDIWALGVVAFECLTGVLPFDGTSLIEIFTRIQAGRHLPVRELAPELRPSSRSGSPWRARSSPAGASAARPSRPAHSRCRSSRRDGEMTGRCLPPRGAIRPSARALPPRRSRARRCRAPAC